MINPPKRNISIIYFRLKKDMQNQSSHPLFSASGKVNASKVEYYDTLQSGECELNLSNLKQQDIIISFT